MFFAHSQKLHLIQNSLHTGVSEEETESEGKDTDVFLYMHLTIYYLHIDDVDGMDVVEENKALNGWKGSIEIDIASLFHE